MNMSIQNNMLAMNAERIVGITSGKKSKSTEKLSSGYRINRAADDAAGLAISEKMRRQIKGLTRGTRNAQDGISMCQIADGALNEVSDMMHRLTELSVQSANGTNDEQDRQAIQQEVNALLEEIDRVSDTTTFNEQKIFSDSVGDENSVLGSPYEMAREELLNGTYKSVVADIELENGKIISAKDANTIISMCSSCVITDELCESGYYQHRYEDDYLTDYKWKLYDKYTPVMAKNIESVLGYSVKDEFLDYMEQGNEKILGDLFNGHYNPWRAFETFRDAYYSVKNLDESVYPQSYICSAGADAMCAFTFANGNDGNAGGNLRSASHEFGEIAGRMLMNQYDIRGTKLEGIINPTTNSNNYTFWSVNADKSVKLYMALVGEDIDSFDDKNMREFWIQSGAEAGDGIMLQFGMMDTGVLDIRGLDVSTQSGAEDAISRVKSGLGVLSGIRSDIGAQQNRLEHTIRHQENTIENTQAAESQIRDADMAVEMVDYSNQNIIEQAGISMLSQANQQKQGILSLLQ